MDRAVCQFPRMDARRQHLTVEGAPRRSAAALSRGSDLGHRTAQGGDDWDTTFRNAALNRFNRVGVCAEIVEQSAPTRRVFARACEVARLSATAQGARSFQYMRLTDWAGLPMGRC